jgi:hypothetical protein
LECWAPLALTICIDLFVAFASPTVNESIDLLQDYGTGPHTPSLK